MASYEAIRDFFDHSDELQGIARRAASIPIVSGFTLDVDSSWIVAFDRASGLMNIPEPRRTEYELDGRFFSSRVVGYRPRDLNAKLPDWESHAEGFYKQYGKKLLPIVLSVIHRPLRSAGPGEEAGDFRLLQQLVRAVREASVAVRIEERPRARLAFASGDEIAVNPGKSGTLGRRSE